MSLSLTRRVVYHALAGAVALLLPSSGAAESRRTDEAIVAARR
ncbi:hypothetical protein T8K17_11030 [Thalassobaculum sp. OXR-137]|nr:hypothetical protein [Thalassobaculum sp. OXR-137]WPZ36669.1 hypothetical protein T8K17_11030 [Thalassobaculum sp. OXR-137]